MFRVFGLAGAFVLVVVAAGVVVVLDVVVSDEEPAGVLLVVADAGAEPVSLTLPVGGVFDVAGVVTGSVVSGVGTGGNGLDMTLAIRSVSPASD